MTTDFELRCRAWRRWIADRPVLPVGYGLDNHPDGHAVDSLYAETHWLPVIGPSALWAARRLVRVLAPGSDDLDAIVDYPLGVLAVELGLGTGTHANAPVVRALARLLMFGVAEADDEVYRISPRVPTVSTRNARRVTDQLRRVAVANVARVS